MYRMVVLCWLVVVVVVATRSEDFPTNLHRT